MQLSQKQKRVLRWAGYPVLALVTFVFAVHLTFPYERVKDRFFVEPLSDRFDVSVLSVERTFLPGGMILRSVALRTRPTAADEKPSTLFFDEVRLDLGLLALLRGRAQLGVVAELGGGSVKGKVSASRAEIDVAFTTRGLPLANIPGVQGAVGLPMKGGLDATVDVVLPEGRWDRASGTVTLACPGCIVGDGTAKIKPRTPPGRRMAGNMGVFASEGMTVPELKLGKVSGRITIANGKGTVESFRAESADGELELQAEIRFGRQFKDSTFERGCLKFKLSDELKQREPSFGNLPEFMGVSPQSDGYALLSPRGKLATMRWVPTRSCDDGPDSGAGERVSSRPPRPTVSPTPQVPDPGTGIGVAAPPGVGLPVGGAPEDEVKPPVEDEVNVPDYRTSGPPMRESRDDVGVPVDTPADGYERKPSWPEGEPRLPEPGPGGRPWERQRYERVDDQHQNERGDDPHQEGDGVQQGEQKYDDM